MKRSNILAAIFVAAFIVPISAQAASFKSLNSKGYNVSKLTTSKGGSRGWVVSNGQKRYFCKMKVSIFYGGKTGMGMFTQTGRIISLDKTAYESKNDGPAHGAPQYKDLIAGRPRPQDVGRCIPFS